MATQYQVIAIGEWGRKLVSTWSNPVDAYERYATYIGPLAEGNLNGLLWLEDGVECQPQVAALPAEKTQEEINEEVARLTGLAPLSDYEMECKVANFVGGLIPAPKQEVQMVVSDEVPSPESIQFSSPVKNDGIQSVKPRGGFWTSAFDGESSEWVRWCEREMPEWAEGKRFLLVPSKSARIYTIKSVADLEHLVVAFPRKVRNGIFLDYVAIAREYDGLHLSKEGEQAIRAHGQCALNDLLYQEEWSAESTVWFRWCFESVKAA